MAAFWGGRVGGGGLWQRTCGGVEHGAAAAPAPSGTPGGEAGSGGNTGGRVSVRTPAPGEWLQPRRKGGAENGVGEEGMGGDGEGGRGGAPPCRPTPEALSRGRGRGPVAAGPAGVRASGGPSPAAPARAAGGIAGARAWPRREWRSGRSGGGGRAGGRAGLNWAEARRKARRGRRRGGGGGGRGLAAAGREDRQGR